MFVFSLQSNWHPLPICIHNPLLCTCTYTPNKLTLPELSTQFRSLGSKVSPALAISSKSWINSSTSPSMQTSKKRVSSSSNSSPSLSQVILESFLFSSRVISPQINRDHNSYLFLLKWEKAQQMDLKINAYVEYRAYLNLAWRLLLLCLVPNSTLL